MPWIEALLRGQKVLARAKADGSFESEGGRVEIRYKPTDGRAYRAAEANLKVVDGAALLPDEACAAGDFVAKPAADAASGATAAASKPAKKAAAATKAAAEASTFEAEWISYTDGACSGNPGPAGLGYVVIGPGGVIHEGYEFLGTATNNIAELTAILRAVESIPRSELGTLVHTDSQYAIGVLSKGWKAKVNQELIASIKAAMAAHGKVRLVYVPGHAGVPMNERADELAREAIRVRGAKPVLIGSVGR